MPKSRKEHLDWCKQRALEELEHNGTVAGVRSMLSDLLKADEPLYEPLTYQTLAADGMMFRNTPEQVRDWINGFN